MTTQTQAKQTLKKLRNIIHPDKVAEEHKVEAGEVFKLATKYYDGGQYSKLDDLYAIHKDGFKPAPKPLTDDDHIKVLRDMLNAGNTRAMGKGYLMMNGIDGKHATNLLDQVFQRGGGVSKAAVVALIIELEKGGYSKAEMNREICRKFNYRKASAATILASLEYMHQYAMQTK